ncbi:EamA family transporter RarD [Cobetia crustatorum]|uniref:EamA family transporter RarD n=1 Tax=Cobetia crustatorum TaxID=553385 RepID=UPI00046AFEEF|nr:EamA family transporter RarD [Cobetia crustatorum]
MNKPSPTLATAQQQARSEELKGVGFGLTAYVMWGCFPLYFALFSGIPAWEVLLHRIVWSCLFLVVLISLLRRWAPIRAALAKPRQLWPGLVCSLLIAANWGIYIYAVEQHEVLQASLGYFLTPLVNVALGMLFLKERLTRLQAIALGLAALGLSLQLIGLTELPWITLSLALSFGTYGLLRKRVALDGLSGLFVETLMLAPIALLLIGGLWRAGESHFLATDIGPLELPASVLMISSGVLTALPLLAFAGAARRLRLATVGFLMYINPSMQFVIALLVFQEALSASMLITFVLIWSGLALYSASTLLEHRASGRRRRAERDEITQRERSDVRP